MVNQKQSEAPTWVRISLEVCRFVDWFNYPDWFFYLQIIFYEKGLKSMEILFLWRKKKVQLFHVWFGLDIQEWLLSVEGYSVCSYSNLGDIKKSDIVFSTVNASVLKIFLEYYLSVLKSCMFSIWGLSYLCCHRTS